MNKAARLQAAARAVKLNELLELAIASGIAEGPQERFDWFKGVFEDELKSILTELVETDSETTS